jgi:hypothetical protein
MFETGDLELVLIVVLVCLPWILAPVTLLRSSFRIMHGACLSVGFMAIWSISLAAWLVSTVIGHLVPRTLLHDLLNPCDRQIAVPVQDRVNLSWQRLVARLFIIRSHQVRFHVSGVWLQKFPRWLLDRSSKHLK